MRLSHYSWYSDLLVMENKMAVLFPMATALYSFSLYWAVFSCSFYSSFLIFLVFFHFEIHCFRRFFERRYEFPRFAKIDSSNMCQVLHKVFAADANPVLPNFVLEIVRGDIFFIMIRPDANDAGLFIESNHDFFRFAELLNHCCVH